MVAYSALAGDCVNPTMLCGVCTMSGQRSADTSTTKPVLRQPSLQTHAAPLYSIPSQQRSVASLLQHASTPRPRITTLGSQRQGKIHHNLQLKQLLPLPRGNGLPCRARRGAAAACGSRQQELQPCACAAAQPGQHYNHEGRSGRGRLNGRQPCGRGCYTRQQYRCARYEAVGGKSNSSVSTHGCRCWA